MDVVYIVRPGDKNEALRYSLRSLVNLDHDRVWLAGYRPLWVDGVGHIPTVQHLDKHANSTLNVRAACESGDVSDPFALFNDDFFVMRAVDEIPTWHRGSVAAMLRHPKVAGQWRSGAGETLELLHTLGYADPYSYELHIPIVVGKQAMLHALELGRGVKSLHKRTLYGNLAGLGGVEHADVKVDGSTVPDESWPFWSTTDDSFRYQRVGDTIRARFPAASQYETDIPHQEGSAMPMYVNTRTGALTRVADPAEVPNRKAAVHTRRTIERMDRSKRWRRATDEEIAASRPAKKTAAKKTVAKKTAPKAPEPAEVATASGDEPGEDSP